MHKTRPFRHTRRTLPGTLVALLVAPAAIVFGPVPHAQAVTRQVATAQAGAYARTHGYHVGIAVLDTKTAQFYGSGYYDKSTFASESVVKVFIAARLLVTGRMHGTTSRRAYKMITQSDDAIASSLYGSVGGDGLITWIKRYFHESDLGSPPRRANWWGNTHIRAKGLARLYAKLKADRRVGPWLLNAMHHATTYGSDGQYQFFGIRSASPGAAIKQGWGADYDDWSLSADFNTTGFVDHDRYAVAILARGPLGTYGTKIGAMLTAVAKRLLPHGTFPDPAPTITALSARSGRVAGGTTVTIRGTDLTGVQAVYFGAVRAPVVRVVSRSRIQAVTPLHTGGRVDVRVRTDHGTSARSPGDRFAFVRAPAITAMSPHSGPTGGGTVVIVEGTDFTSVRAVTFGTTAAAAVHVLSSHRLQVTAPGRNAGAGAVDVSVTTSYGRSPSVAPDRYTYLAAPTKP